MAHPQLLLRIQVAQMEKILYTIIADVSLYKQDKSKLFYLQAYIFVVHS